MLRTFERTARVHPEMVARGSDQGRRLFETAGVAGLRRGSQKGANADL